MLFGLVAFLIIILWYSKVAYKSYFSHLSVFIGVNIGSLILMYGCSIIDSSISLITWVYICTMFLCFLAGSYIGKFRFTLGKQNIVRTAYERVSNVVRLRRLIIVYSIIYDIFAFYYLYRLNTYYGIGRMFGDMSGINLAFQTGDFSLGISSYFTPIGIPLSLMLLYYKKKVKGSILLYVQYALCYIQCISPRRDNLFFMIMMTLLFIVSQSFRNITISAKAKKTIKRGIGIVLLIVAAVWVMSYTQNLMNKSSGLDFTVLGFKAPEFLKDVCIYAAGNYPYLEKTLLMGELKFVFPLISTLRLFYRYICGPLGFEIDTMTPFALGFLNIGASTSMTFNTAPILYYLIIEAGIGFGIAVIVMGIISRKAFEILRNRDAIGSIMLSLMQFDILIFSFRSYNLIYLSYILAIIYMFIAHIYIDKDYREREEVGA